MDLLDHPLEAVAFRLYSLPEAAAASGAAWTCLAAVLAAAAAAGLWRLRASAPAAVAATAKNSPPAPAVDSPAPASSTERSPEHSTSSSSPAPSPKVRYTAYYYGSERVGCCHVDDDRDPKAEEEEEEEEGDDGVYEPSDPFEREVAAARRRMAAELGWYGYQDLTALNGSVVRLWENGADGGLTPTSARRSGRVGILAF